MHIQMLLPRGCLYTQKCLYAEVLLHSDAFKQTKTFAHRRVGTFTRRYAWVHLHTDAWVLTTGRCFSTANVFTQDVLLHGDSFDTELAFTHRNCLHAYTLAQRCFFYTEIYTCVHKGVFLRTDAFTQRRFCTDTFARRDAFTHRCF